jgi:uncharacterized Zn finger protein (UPF0148 family)
MKICLECLKRPVENDHKLCPKCEKRVEIERHDRKESHKRNAEALNRLHQRTYHDE